MMFGILKRIAFCYRQWHERSAKLSPFSKYLNLRHIRIGERVFIGEGCVLFPMRRYGKEEFVASITIGDDAYIGHHTQLHCIGALQIGRGAVISDHVYISDVAHGLSPLDGPIMKQALNSRGPVSIGDDCFVGFGASIMPGVVLGNNCVVAARTVVTKSFPPYSMLVGAPAKLVKTFDFEKKAWVEIAQQSEAAGH
jgi:acetyltransferase-like isoleucine patch superfamily enzyme